MQFIETPLLGLYIINYTKFEDERGFFARTFCKKEFSQIGFNKELVQLNHSFNVKKGTVRGLHYQKMPFSESKLIRCIQGRVFDVAVDIRQNSPTYLQYFSIELSADNMSALFIPNGFAHGFQTLEKNSSLIYHHSEYYTPEADAGLRYNDPGINIKWPLPVVNLSVKDKQSPFLDVNFKAIEI
jgi:dTDP-4-dehydrorhamnose 3,5-epimerase